MLIIDARKLVKNCSNGNIIDDGIKINIINRAIERLSYINEDNYVVLLAYYIKAKSYNLENIISFCKVIDSDITKALQILNKIKSISNDFKV